MPRKSSGKNRSKKHFASGITGHNHLTFGHCDLKRLPSDDSEDSDYEPAETDKPTTSKKRKRGSTSSTPVSKKSTKTDDLLKHRNTSLHWSHQIPNEILYKVFMFAVTGSNAVPLLCRVCQVCRKWNGVASDSSLWYKIDLSFMAAATTILKADEKILHLLNRRGLLKCIKYLNFTGWKKLTEPGLELIATQCRKLTHLNLSNCPRISAKGLSLVACNLKELSSINLSYIQSEATSNMSIKNLLHEQGCRLKTLCLAGNKSIGSPSLVAIQSFCRKLRYLDLSHTAVNNLHVEKLQAGCPKMIELRLSNLYLSPSAVRTNLMEESSGFQDLELLSLASVTGGVGIDDNLLQSLLKTSTKLRQLDLRGCEKITHRAFLNLPVESLEQLFISRCKEMSWKDLFEIIERRWKESLNHLDVSWGHRLDDVALLTLAGTQTSHTVLTELNLAGSGITSIGLRRIVDSSPRLTELNLTSCHGIPRGLKQLHDTETIRKLRTQLQTSPDLVELH